MSAVTILTQGSQARSGSSSALDVTAFSTLRLDLVARADLGVSPFLRTYVETAPATTGPWRVVDERHMTTGAAVGATHAWPAGFTTRITLGGFDKFVRLRWAGGCEGQGSTKTYAPPYTGNGGTLISENLGTDPQFVIGLTGDGKPD